VTTFMNSHVTHIFFGEATVTWQNMWERSNGKFSHNRKFSRRKKTGSLPCRRGEAPIKTCYQRPTSTDLRWSDYQTARLAGQLSLVRLCERSAFSVGRLVRRQRHL
jgi:hypothetical protein